MAKNQAAVQSKTQQHTHREEPYSVNVNGGSLGPHLQSVSNDMFLTPSLKPGNEITLVGRLSDDSRLNIELGSGTRNGSIWQLNSNICRINIANRKDEADSEDYIKINTPSNEVEIDNNLASDWFTNGPEYVFKFKFYSNYLKLRMATSEDTGAQPMAYIYGDEIYRINMLSVNGTVQKFTVEFLTDDE